MESVFQIFSTSIVLRRVPFEQLNDLMTDLLPEDVGCIDMQDHTIQRINQEVIVDDWRI